MRLCLEQPTLAHNVKRFLLLNYVQEEAKLADQEVSRSPPRRLINFFASFNPCYA